MKRYEKPVKPHVYFRAGYWRVTHMPKPWALTTYAQRESWEESHNYVNKMNFGRYPGGNTPIERLREPWGSN